MICSMMMQQERGGAWCGEAWPERENVDEHVQTFVDHQILILE